MYSAKFTPLNQSDDYRVDHNPHGSPQYIDPALYQQQMYQQQLHAQQQAYVQSPTMYSALHEKPGFQSNTSYISTPPEYSSDSKPFGQDDKRRSSRLSFLGKSNPVSNFKIPTFAAPWQHEKVDSQAASRMNTVRYFDRNKQWWRLFTNGLIQWFMTLSIVAMICVALWGFQKVTPMEQWLRYTFNAVITLLSLCLGLAIVTALRSYAKLLSWRFLASEYRDLQDFELVMNCESQSKVLKLLWAGRTPGKFWLNRTQILCIISLSLVIGLQIIIALMGLTYSIESSPQFIDHVPGNVSMALLSNIQQSFMSTDDNTTSDYAHQVAAANFYGNIGGDYGYYYGQPGVYHQGKNENYTTSSSIGVIGDPNTDSGWSDSYFYQFYEMSAQKASSTWGETKRYITTDATCTQLKIIEGGTIQNDSVVYYDEFGVNRTQNLYSEVATYTTTYMTNTSDVGCGPRCSRLLVIDMGSDPDDPDDTYMPPVLWACNSTVSTVVNANTCLNQSQCTFSDDLARIAAGAIGLAGISRDDEDMQFQLYPQASINSYWLYYGLPWNGTDNMAMDPSIRGAIIAWFSAGVLAAMDNNGPRFYAMGQQPRVGMVLEVKWHLTIPVLAIVPGVQLIVLIIVCIWANGAMVKDGSYLATARLLRPVVEKLDQHGCALTGDEIARELGNFKIIYGARAPQGRGSGTAYSPNGNTNVDWHCGIIRESEGFGDQHAEGWRPGRVWPAGRYDGVGYPDEVHGCSECLSRQRRGAQTGVEEIVDEEHDEDVIDEKAHLL